MEEVDSVVLLFGLYCIEDVGGDFLLHFEDVVQLEAAYIFSEDELEQGVELFFVVFNFESNFHDILDFILANEVEANWYFIFCEDFLPIDFKLSLSHIDRDDLNLGATFPVEIGA